MGMSTDVKGFVPPDEKWEKMKAIYNSCEAAGIDAPQEVSKYFDGCNPNDVQGLEVDIEEAVVEYSNDYQQGFDIDLSKLPPDVKFIRFVNSW